MSVGKTTHLLAADPGAGATQAGSKPSKLGVARGRGIAVLGLPWLIGCLLRWQLLDSGMVVGSAEVALQAPGLSSAALPGSPPAATRYPCFE